MQDLRVCSVNGRILASQVKGLEFDFQQCAPQNWMSEIKEFHGDMLLYYFCCCYCF